LLFLAVLPPFQKIQRPRERALSRRSGYCPDIACPSARGRNSACRMRARKALIPPFWQASSISTRKAARRTQSHTFKRLRGGGACSATMASLTAWALFMLLLSSGGRNDFARMPAPLPAKPRKHPNPGMILASTCRRQGVICRPATLGHRYHARAVFAVLFARLARVALPSGIEPLSPP
jgi:hypothetical protein